MFLIFHLPDPATWLNRKPWAIDLKAGPTAAALLLSLLPFSGLLPSIPLELFGLAIGGVIAYGGRFPAKLRIRPLTGSSWWLYLKLMVFLYLAVGVVGVVWQYLLNRLGIPFQEEQDILTLVRHLRGAELAYLIFSLIVTTPVIEELVFRRVLFGLFRPLGAVHALFLTSLIFAVAHSFLLGIPGLLVMGLAFQVGYLLSGSLLLPILMHMTVNAVTIIAALLF